MADNQFRKRDPRFIDSKTYQEAKAKRRKERGYNASKRFVLADFDYDPVKVSCRCSAGNLMWCRMNNGQINGRKATSFQGYRKDCGPAR